MPPEQNIYQIRQGALLCFHVRISTLNGSCSVLFSGEENTGEKRVEQSRTAERGAALPHSVDTAWPVSPLTGPRLPRAKGCQQCAACVLHGLGLGLPPLDCSVFRGALCLHLIIRTCEGSRNKL